MKNTLARKLLCGMLIAAMSICLFACDGGNGTAPQGQQNQQSQQNQQKPETSLHLDVADYPRMDGSTANLPLMAEVMSRVCGIEQDAAEDFTNCSKTRYAWIALTEGNADILLVYEPDAGTQKELEEMGTKLEVTAIGRDGLVFINNENNPVNNLTTKQLQDIYMGIVTNWQEIGGKDLPIVAFQRRETSGSQAMFQKLLMGDLQPMDAPSEYRPTEMGDLIDELAQYNNSADAIGFSVYYYASQMYTQPGLRLMEVDGIAPTNETIGDGSYPFTNDFYVAIRADEPEDSPARQLYNWICSEEGAETLAAAGYVPVK